MSGTTNVDKLLQEFSIEQLVQIQSSLRQETENKREELRQMVGRRYRDVLEASNTVKRLTEIAGDLFALLADTRQCAAVKSNSGNLQPGKAGSVNLVARREANQRMMLFYTILPMTFTTPDLLSQTFSLCIAEGLQQRLSSEQHHFAEQPAQKDDSNFQPPGQELFQMLSDQLLQCRIELLDALKIGLGAAADWRKVAGLLAAYALMKPQIGMGELLQLYLQARMDMVVTTLNQPDSTLLGVIRHMKDTVQCVEQTFGSGQALLSALQCVTQRGWCPASIQKLLDQQPLSASRQLEAEIVRVNGLRPMDKFPAENQQDVAAACSQWVVKMCAVASERVRAMCSYFERIDQAVEFALAVSQIFKSDWPTTFADSNTMIYRQLFGNALLERLKHLIEQELRQLEQQMHQRLPQTNCQPQPLFHKRTGTVVKFDAQLASGVSAELHDLVQQLSSQLHQLQLNVQKYTTVGQEEDVATLHDVLAEQVLAMVERLTNFTNWQQPPNASPTHTKMGSAEQSTSQQSEAMALSEPGHQPESAAEQRERRARWLALFRFLLALVQHEPSVLCQCMNRNLDRIVQCNRQLHTATEQALCHFMDCVIDDCLRATNLHAQMLECCANITAWLDLLQEPERAQLSETVKVQVPTQISGHIFAFLAAICAELNQNSLGHLFTRNVTLHVSRRIGTLMSQILLDCADHCTRVPFICTQLLLDCRALFNMFPDKHFLEAAQRLEAKLDPIELSVLQEPVQRNAKLFAQRTSMLFGQLQAEPITAFNSGTKEAGQTQLLPSYSALLDLMPKLVDVQRLTQIPRLSKLKEESQRTEDAGRRSPRGGKPSRRTPQLGGATEGGGGLSKGTAAGTTSSFSSLYDKISTGSWFKS